MKEIDRSGFLLYTIALDKAAYCVNTHFLGTKTQLKLFLCVQKCNKNSWYSILNFFIAYDAIVFGLQLPFLHTTQAVVGAKSSILNCKPVQEHSSRYLAIPNTYTITTFISLYDNKGEKVQSNQIILSRNST